MLAEAALIVTAPGFTASMPDNLLCNIIIFDVCRIAAA